MPNRVSHSGSLHCATLILEPELLDPDADPDPEFCGMLIEGSEAMVWIGCAPNWPEPTIT